MVFDAIVPGPSHTVPPPHGSVRPRGSDALPSYRRAYRAPYRIAVGRLAHDGKQAEMQFAASSNREEAARLTSRAKQLGQRAWVERAGAEGRRSLGSLMDTGESLWDVASPYADEQNRVPGLVTAIDSSSGTHHLGLAMYDGITGDRDGATWDDRQLRSTGGAAVGARSGVRRCGDGYPCPRRQGREQLDCRGRHGPRRAPIPSAARARRRKPASPSELFGGRFWDAVPALREELVEVEGGVLDELIVGAAAPRAHVVAREAPADVATADAGVDLVDPHPVLAALLAALAHTVGGEATLLQA